MLVEVLRPHDRKAYNGANRSESADDPGGVIVALELERKNT